MYSGCLINAQQPNVIAPPFLSPDCPDQLVVARTLESTAGRPAHCSKIGTSLPCDKGRSRVSGVRPVRSGAIAVLRLGSVSLHSRATFRFRKHGCMCEFVAVSGVSMTGKTFDSPHPNDTVLRSLLSAG